MHVPQFKRDASMGHENGTHGSEAERGRRDEFRLLDFEYGRNVRKGEEGTRVVCTNCVPNPRRTKLIKIWGAVREF
jgi:hypothetical protein